MANFLNIFKKTSVTTITDAHNFIVSLSTGTSAADIIRWAHLKTLLKTFFQAENLTFTGSVSVPGGTTTDHAVNKGQMDTADGLRLPKTGGTMSGNIAMGSNKITGLAAAANNGEAMRYDEAAKLSSAGIFAINIPELTTPPSSSADTMGAVGDIGWNGDDVYLKNSSGWVKQRFTTF